MKSLFVKLFVLFSMLLGLPLTGIVISGHSPTRYLEFPPQTRYIQHATYSWLFFLCLTIFIITVVIFLLTPLLRQRRTLFRKADGNWPFPWWGWISFLSCIFFWGVAWSRFDLFKQFQPHTFAPLWVSFIVFLNSLSFRKNRRCILTHKTSLFLVLFPISAVFWWFFEYLNRFVQNWYYLGVKYGALEYFILASLSFSTVLPAVASMHELLNNYVEFESCYYRWVKVNVEHLKILPWAVLIIAGIGLACIGFLPDYLFPLLWVSPLLIVVCLQIILREPHILKDLSKGNWVKVVSFSLSALACGFFWEMWNYYSYAKWEYSIPFVHRFQVFEMPILGYAGYLPFGLECALIISIVETLVYKKNR